MRRAWAALSVVTALVVLVLIPVPTDGSVVPYPSDPAASPQQDLETDAVRVIARMTPGGSIEFGAMTHAGRQLPAARFFPRGSRPTNWLVSTPVVVNEDYTIRIIARRNRDGRVEFGIRIEDSQLELFPQARFFPNGIRHNRWLYTSPISLSSPDPEQIDPANDGQQDPDSESPDDSGSSNDNDGSSDPASTPEPGPEAEPEDTSAETDGEDSEVERISGGHRDGLIVENGIVGDPDAPVLISEYGDPF